MATKYPKTVRHHYLYLARPEREKGVKPGLSTTREQVSLEEAFKARGLDSDKYYGDLAPWTLVGGVYLGEIRVEQGYEVEERVRAAIVERLGVMPPPTTGLTEFLEGAEPGAALAILEAVATEWVTTNRV